jgi:alpha-tubulin suppressor-like RCC1 family protein
MNMSIRVAIFRPLLGALLIASPGCEAQLDVLQPASGALSKDSGAGGDMGRVPDARPPPPDVVTKPPDARPPPPDVVTKPPDVLVEPSHSVTDLQASFEDTCAVAAGTLYCWGARPDGVAVLTPKRVEGSAAGVFGRVSGGNKAHCATRTSGGAFCWGKNDRGQLGQGDRVDRTVPARVSLPQSAPSVSGKFESFCARLEDSRLGCWGQNDEGQMGQSDTGMPQDRLIPVQVEMATDWLDVGVGQGHVCGIRSPGALYCWGRNTNGELGLGPGAFDQLRTPTLVAGTQDWTLIVAGQGHTCGIRAPGRLYCFGDGQLGQLGIEPRASSNVPLRIGDADDWRVVDIDTFHSCGIRGAGTLWCWGRNIEGQLGVGDVNDRDVPTRVGNDSDWADVSTGRFHTCARKTDGTAWCTGTSDGGRLGNGDLERRSTMTPVIWGAG